MPISNGSDRERYAPVFKKMRRVADRSTALFLKGDRDTRKEARERLLLLPHLSPPCSYAKR